MNDDQRDTAQTCLRAQENDRMPFTQAMSTLSEAGFEGYTVDFRRSATTFYLPSGENVELPSRRTGTAVAAAFDVRAVEAALKESTTLPGARPYRQFCDMLKAAGCAGYIVSFSGRRIVYFGRTGEVHTDFIPEDVVSAD